MHSLNSEERLRLLSFVCSFAWADLRIQPQEREFVRKLVRRLELPEDERREVDAMLVRPPRAEEIDPTEVPLAHRQLFVRTVKQIVLADGVIDPAEAEQLDLFEQLLEL
jgi:uncharacterized tellurite resistance protein B-like protein